MELRQPYLIGLLSCCLLGAAPSRTQTYVTGTVIDPAKVTENEDNIYSYLQAGVDTYRTDSVTSTAILDGTVSSTDITNSTIVNADINSSAAIDFSKLASLTSGAILVGNASNVATSVTMSGDATLSNAGALTIADNSVDGTDIAIGSDAQGDILYYNGTDYVRLGAGTSGQLLQTQGAGANPQWATQTPAWIYVETITLSGATTSTSTLPTTAQMFMLVLDEAKSSAGALQMRPNANSTADKDYVYIDGSMVATRATGQTLIVLSTTTNPLFGSLIFNRVADAAVGSHGFSTQLTDSDVSNNVLFKAAWKNGAAITTIQFLSASGTLSGKVQVFRSSQT